MKKRKLRRAPTAPSTCPCGSGRTYVQCCAPLHTGERDAGEPSQLVAARFSAYVTGKGDYLWATLHSSHSDRARDREAFGAALQRSLSCMRYRGLRILDSRAPDAHGIASVLFSVEAEQNRRDVSFVEKSDFVQEDGQWRYLQGVLRPRSQLSHAEAALSLDHWDCTHPH